MEAIHSARGTSAGMSTLLLPLLAGLLALVFALGWRRKTPAPYPPGPPPRLFIGNAAEILSEMKWVKYLEWSKRLNSDIIHMSAMNSHIVVLHKMEDITELMEKRSAIYSSRPWIPAAEMLGIDYVTGLIPYGDKFRRHRTIYHECLRKELMPLYQGAHTEIVHSVIDQLLSDPESFRSHCKWLGIAITMSTTFGCDITLTDEDDRYTALAAQVLAVISQLLQPGGTLVNVIPFLRYVLPWIPGASTWRLVANAKEASIAYKTETYESVKSNLLAGTSKDCILTRLLRHHLRDDGVTFEGEDDLKETMANIYLAGAETLQVTQLVFFVAMALYPSVQKRIQDEIDSVVGEGRLPTYEDRASLPHVEAVLRETLRWRPAVPLAVPHVSVKDDIYKGFYIPEGTLVFANAWAISQDEERYSNPDSFDPERFFSTDGTLNDDRVEYAFGYGRRICPGRFMARDVLWIMMASVLATLNISKAKDENGVEIEIDPNAFSSGISSAPQPFKCSIVPRSPRAAELIRTVAMVAKEKMSTE